MRQTSLNGPPGLRLIDDAPVPSPGPGEVLVRVAAAGVNFVDVSQAHGTFAGGPQPPYAAGIEGAGEVVALGEGVDGPEPGTHVISVGVEGGAFADYMVLPAAAAVPVPVGWGDEQALGMVVNWPTALAALKPLGHIEAGQTVLIHAAAGGTGQVAVRLAKHYGATVIAAASPGKHEVVLGLGADHVIDSRATDLAGEVLRRSRDHQLGIGLQAPSPPDRPEHRHSDPGRTGDLRRGHGGDGRAPRGRGARPRPAHHLRTGRGAKALAELEARATVGKLALLP